MPFKNFVVTIDAPEGQQRHTVGVNPMTIGRSYSVDLPLSLNEVSRNHMKIYFKEGQVYIEDLGSKNGSFLNGKQLDPYQPVLYRDGDKVTLGATREVLTFSAYLNEISEKSQSRIDFSLEDDFASQAPPPPPVAEPAVAAVAAPKVEKIIEKIPEKNVVEKVKTEVREESFVSKKTDFLAEKWQEWDEKKRGLEQELTDLVAKAQDAAAESKVIETQLQDLTEKKAELESQVKEQQTKLNFLQSEVKTTDQQLKAKKEEMLEEQAGLRKELQVELQKMKTVFDTRKVELDQLKTELAKKTSESNRVFQEEKEKAAQLQTMTEKFREIKSSVDELESKKAELSAEVRNKEKFMDEVRKEAEEHFVDRQNELLKEQERVTNLAEKRTLEVEMEMAELKIKRLHDLEKQLEREKRSSEEELKRRAEGLALQLTTLIQQRIKARTKEGPLREGLQHLCDELPIMIRENFEGGGVVAPQVSAVVERTAVAEKPAPAVAVDEAKISERPKLEEKGASKENLEEDVSARPVPFYRRPLIQVASVGAVVVLVVSGWMITNSTESLHFASFLPLSESYTDRMLAEPQYLDFEKDSEWQKRWVQELNSVLVVEKGVDPAAVRKFAAEERNFISRLEQEKAGGAAGESAMREKEGEFEKLASEILGDKKNFILVQKAKNKFYRQFAEAVRTE